MKNIIRSPLLGTEEFLAELFEKDDYDPSLPFCYPYIVTREDGEEKVFPLPEAVSEALNSLPLSKGKNDAQPWAREKKALILRFGLDDGRKRSYRQVAKEFGGITGPYAECMIRRAFHQLRYPSRSRKLREFLVLSPREMARKNEELERVKDQLRQSEEARRQLIETLKERELEGIGGLESKDLTQTTQFLNEDRKALNDFIQKHPNNRVWNAVRWSDGLDEPVRGFSQLVRAVRSREIRRARNIGQKAEEFLQAILQEAELTKGALS